VLHKILYIIAESIGITVFNNYVKMNYTFHILCVISKEKKKNIKFSKNIC